MLHILNPFLTYHLRGVPLSKLLNRSVEANIWEKIVFCVCEDRYSVNETAFCGLYTNRYVGIRKTDIPHLHNSFENAV